MVLLVTLIAGSSATASSTPSAVVEWSAGPDAPTIGLIGDSTLSGVRWMEGYGELQRFNFTFDAESCRRTIETSCWSREQYRSINAITALRDRAGSWGQVLVVMMGYNDPSDGFADAVETMTAEARRQGISTVVWLSLRTKGVNYEEPLHLANGGTYREANRTLYRLAAESGGYLQIADWATHSADHPEWFESDGVHLARPGVDAVTSFIAARVDEVLAGANVTPDPPPWEDIREGDDGRYVVSVQQRLLALGIESIGGADGVYGAQSATAVAEYQARSGLPETGVVDEATAVALGVYEPPAPTAVAAAPTTAAPAATVAPVSVGTVPPIDAGGSSAGGWWIVVGVAAVGWLGSRALRRSSRRRRPPPARRTAAHRSGATTSAERGATSPSSRATSRATSRAATPTPPRTGTPSSRATSRATTPTPPRTGTPSSRRTGGSGASRPSAGDPRRRSTGRR